MAPEAHYRGRFAPSPTGPLHFGSLVTALGSFLDARANGGEWFVRIEDIDPPRAQAGAAQTILTQLISHGLQWDGDISYQSTRIGKYQEVLTEMADRELTYRCVCTRKQVTSTAYPGTCRDGGKARSSEQHSLRVKTEKEPTRFTDRVHGQISERIDVIYGDYIVRRSDNLIAYNLAVALDDALQEISDVVRGADLLASTARQIYLHKLLELPSPRYAHLPLATDATGHKLSKQSHAPILVDTEAPQTLVDALRFLGQSPPIELFEDPVAAIVEWGIRNWDLGKVPR